jgi:hypothetical protein
VRDDVAERDLFSRLDTYEGHTLVAPLPPLEGQTTEMSGALAGELDMDPSWLDVFDDPGDSDLIPPQI